MFQTKHTYVSECDRPILNSQALWRIKISTKFSSESLKGKDHLEDLGVDGNNIKNGSESNGIEGYGLYSSGSEQAPAAVCCEHGN
jgi:hypothetical protein